jgi:hypothetical protein
MKDRTEAPMNSPSQPPTFAENKNKIFFNDFFFAVDKQKHQLANCNGKSTLLVHCLYKMSTLNYKRTTSSLAPPIIYVAKNLAIER